MSLRFSFICRELSILDLQNTIGKIMNNVNFTSHLNSLINELGMLKKNSGDNTSYEYLLKQLSELSVDNFENQRKMILHFIADSYEGDINVGNRIIQFLQSCKID